MLVLKCVHTPRHIRQQFGFFLQHLHESFHLQGFHLAHDLLYSLFGGNQKVGGHSRPGDDVAEEREGHNDAQRYEDAVDGGVVLVVYAVDSIDEHQGGCCYNTTYDEEHQDEVGNAAQRLEEALLYNWKRKWKEILLVWNCVVHYGVSDHILSTVTKEGLVDILLAEIDGNLYSHMYIKFKQH